MRPPPGSDLDPDFPSDSFGTTVDFLGDLLAVGNDAHDDGIIPNKGAVYLYRHQRGEWVLIDTLTPSNGTVNTRFGSSVKFARTIDRHRRFDILVATRGLTARQERSAYLYQPLNIDEPRYVEQRRYSLPATAEDLSVCCSDIDMYDGEHVLIGVPQQDLAAEDSGAVHFFLPHTLEFITPPSGNPNPSIFTELVDVSVLAVDSHDHFVGYEWSSECPELEDPGRFTNRFNASTSWLTPDNRTGDSTNCTISVRASEFDSGLTEVRSYVQGVENTPHGIFIIQEPHATPNPARFHPDRPLLSVHAVDSENHPLEYLWFLTSCVLQATGESWSAGYIVTPPQPSHDPNATLIMSRRNQEPVECEVRVIISDGFGTEVRSSFTQVFTP